MLNLRNEQTNEVITVSNVNFADGRIIGRYEFGARFYNKYGRMLKRIGAEGNQPVLELQDGWVVDGSKKRIRQRESNDDNNIVKDDAPKRQEPKREIGEVKAVMNEQQRMIVDALLGKNFEANLVANIMDAIKPMISQSVPVVRYEIKQGEQVKQLKEGIYHKEFTNILTLVQHGVAPYLYGRSGTGKTEIAAQLAEAMGLKLYVTTAPQTKFDILGYANAAGKLVETEFYHAFTKGGLFLFDEFDASDAGACVAVNDALSQGWAEFPVIGRVNAHKDFRCIAAGNTSGTGATEEYSARNVIDAASLNRFFFVEVDYDARIEQAMANNDAEVLEFCRGLRKAAQETGIRLVISYRNIKLLYAYSKLFADEFNLRGAIFKGVDKDEMRILMNKMRCHENRWYKSAQKMAA